MPNSDQHIQRLCKRTRRGMVNSQDISDQMCGKLYSLAKKNKLIKKTNKNNNNKSWKSIKH